jgi:hypothetical protein
MRRHFLIFALALLAILPAISSNIVILEKDAYQLNEVMTIRINSTERDDLKVDLISAFRNYTYFSPVAQFRYIPVFPGNYSLRLYDKGILVEEQGFKVIDPNVVSIATDRKNYTVGEQVRIIIDATTLDGLSLEVISEGIAYNYLGPIRNEVIFNPKTHGTYEVKIIGNKAVMASTTINVGPRILENYYPYHPAIGRNSSSSSRRYFTVKNSLGQVTFTDIKLTDKATGQVYEIGSQENPMLPNGKYDVLMKPNVAGMEEIEFHDVDLSTTFDLRVEDVPASRSAEGAVRTFAIDPSSIAFADAQITMVASDSGRQLLKCKEWDFASQTCNGDWKFVQALVPGEEYSIQIDPSDPAYAEVGVASVNTRKSTYLPGETVQFEIVAIDTEGFLVEAAQIWLTVISPDNESITLEGYDIGAIRRGLYYAEYPASAEGNYSVFLRIEGDGVNNTLYTHFEVSSSHQFDIIRDMPSTVDWKKGDFESKITLVSRYHEGTFDFTEKVPINFTVSSSSAIITNDSEYYHLRWTGLTNNSNIGYTVSPPKQSPELFEFGPSVIGYGIETYAESRPWFLAIDPTYAGGFYMFYSGLLNEPPGWVCVSCNVSGAFYGRFIRGSDVYGGTGGSLTHTHALGYVSSGGASATGGLSSATASAASAAHTHSSLSGESITDGSNLPSYRQLKVIKYSGTGVPERIPAGAIALYNSSTMPANWTRYSAQDNYFVFGNQTSNMTGGSNTHSHTVSAGLGASTGTANRRTDGSQINVGASGHSHSAGSASSSSVDHRPPYTSVILGVASVETHIPFKAGLIAIVDQDSPDGWTNYSLPSSTLYNRFIYGSSAFGTTGGNLDHGHANLAITTGAPTTLTTTRSGGNAFTTGTHTHSVTASIATSNHLPPYINVTFANADTYIEPEADSVPSIILNSPAIDFNSSSTTVDFTCTATDDWDIVNITLYTNISGPFSKNYTIDVLGGPNTSFAGNFRISNITNGTSFVWNCLVCDNSTAGQCSFASANRTVTVRERPDPVVTLNSPPDGQQQTASTISFNCSATDDKDIASLSLYTNRTGVFAFEQAATFTGQVDLSVNYVFSQSGFEDGKGIVWNCRAVDNDSRESYAPSNFSFEVDLGIPNSTLNSPADMTTDTDGVLQLSCTGTDSQDISSIALYTNITGSFAAYQTATYSGGSDTSVTPVFNVTVPYGTSFRWNCLVTDSSSYNAFAQSNWSVAVPKLDHFFGNLAAGGWSSSTNAVGSPDSVTANELLNTEAILSIDNMTGVPTTGTLLATYYSIAWYVSATGGNDVLRLGYSLSDYPDANLALSGAAYAIGSASTATPLTTTMQNQSFEITGTLTASDLDDIRLFAQGDQVTSPDYNTAYIDSIWLSILFDYLPYPVSADKSPSVVFQDYNISFSSAWQDDIFLGCYIFSINQTGTWTNTSCINFPAGSSSGIANYTYQITAAPGTNVQWRFYANDSRNQWNSTQIYSFVVADPDDIINPTIYNEKVEPVSNSSGSIFNISATITDNYQVDRAYAELFMPSGQAVNLTLSNYLSSYYALYQPSIGGNYSFRIIAFDAVNNSNYSSTYPRFNVTSAISSGFRYYERGDTIQIAGRGYSASGSATLNIYRSNSSSVAGYPANIGTDATGSFSSAWTIPGTLSERLDNYTIEANDTSVSWLKNSTEIAVVVKSDDSNKYDSSFPTGTGVLAELNQSDDLTTTLVSRATAAYIDLRFQDLILDGYSLDDLILYVEHQDFDAGSDPLVVQYYDGAAYQTASCASIPFSSANTIGACNLTADIGSIPDWNDIRIRLTNNNLGTSGSDFSTIDIAYLDIDFSISNTLAVDILVPSNEHTVIDYTDPVRNDAFYGSTTAIVSTTKLIGTEASSSDYDRLDSSDNSRWQSTTTTSGSYAYQGFYLYVNIPSADITNIDVEWEGYITKNGVNAEPIRIFAWNYITGSYTDLAGGAVTGSTVDQTLTYALPGTVTNFINSTGYIHVLVESSSNLQGAPQVRLDIFTDYVKLDVYSLKTISGYQDINISAVDGDGVDNCTVNFINSSNYRYGDIYTSKLEDFFFYNLTDTSSYIDGVYNITANCTDGTERATDSVLVRIYNVAPTVALMYPAEGLNFTVNDINFTWNASQETGNPICDLYIDSRINVSGIVSNNKQNTTQQVSDIADGNHNWSLACRNFAGVSGYSVTRNFTVDSTAPAVTLSAPANYNITGNSNITFYYNAADISYMNCSLLIDNLVNRTNSSVAPNQQTSLFVGDISEGNHTWQAICTDRFGFTGSSVRNNLTVDLTDPNVTLAFPYNGDVFIGGMVQFNYTAYDNLDATLTCNLMVNNIVEFPSVSSPNATSMVMSKELTSGIKWWNVTCMDDAGRRYTSVTRNFTVTGPPTVTLHSPGNMTSQNLDDVTFVYIADDTDGVKNCSLYINSQYNRTNTTIFTGAYNNFTVYGMQEGYYNWSVQCIDNMLDQTTASPYKVTIDRTPPNVTLITPLPGAFSESGDLSFNFSVFDNLDSSLTCTLYIDGLARTPANTDFEAVNNSIQRRNETGMLGGEHLWDITCMDDSGLYGYTDSWDFTIGGIPNVTLISPANNSYSKGNISFIYYAWDDGSIASCSLYVNDQLNATNTTIFNGQNNNFTLYDVPETLLNWSVNCTDNLGLSKKSGHHYVNIDNTPPLVSLYHPDGETFPTATGTFNFSVIENSPGDLMCSIMIDGVVADPYSSASNGTNIRTISSLAETTSYWNATCYDEAGWYSTSQTFNYTVSLAPYVSLTSPEDQSVDIDGDITFTFSVEGSNIQNCSIYLNGTQNNSIYSGDIIPYGTSEIVVTGLSEGIYDWTIGCFNDNGVSANASNGPWSVHVDSEHPWVNLSMPYNGMNYSTRSILFNFTAYDNVDDTLMCNLSINGEVNETDIMADNGVPTTLTVSNFMPGTYYWNVTCTDGYFMNQSETYNFTITVYPTIELVSPSPGYADMDGDIWFTYIPSTINESGFLSCSLLIDDSINQTNATLTPSDNGISLGFYAPSISQGYHNWSVSCTDFAGRAGTSEIRTFIVDLTDPTITLYYPEGHVMNSSFSFNFSAYDNVDMSLTCSLDNNGTVSSGIVADNGVDAIYPVSGLTDGFFYWNVTCVDDAGRQNTSYTYNYTVMERPSVSLIGPADGYRNTTTSHTFTYDANDNSGAISYCEFIIDSSVNATNMTIFPGQENNFTFSGFSDGSYWWTVNCTDPSGNTGTDDPYQLIVDLTGPSIEPIFPVEGGTYNYEDLNFTWNATDRWGTDLVCNITLDGLDNVTGIPVVSGGISNYTIFAMAQGEHNWTMYCSDDLGNMNYSSTINFTVNAPDLTLNSSHIRFNNTNPDENETLTINATIYNIGGATANNIPIEFWDGLPGIGSLIGTVQTIPTLPAQQTATVNVSWNITSGYHDIYVIINYTGVELNSTNNNASKNITVLYSTILSPENNTWHPALTREFNFTIGDWTGSSIDYSIIVDGLPNGQTGTVADGSTSSIDITFAQGMHTVAVRATDDLGRIKDSPAITIYIDTTAPSTTFGILNRTIFNVSTPLINFTIDDNLDPMLNYTLYVDGIAKNISSSPDGALENVTLESLADGLHVVIVEAYDEAGNILNSTPLYFYVDTVKPTVWLVGPPDTTVLFVNTTYLNFSAYDNIDTLLYCNITIDNAVEMSNIPLENNTVNSTLFTGLDEGLHFWNVTCWDGNDITPVSSINYSSTWSFEITIPPLISLLTPLDNNWTNSENVTFYFTADDDTGLMNCSLIINDQVNQTKQGAELALTGISNFTVDRMLGTYNWSVACYDNTTYRNYARTENRTLNVDPVAPYAYIETPTGSWFNSATPLISFNLSDNMDLNVSYAFFANGTLNKEGNETIGVSHSTNLLSLADGGYTLELQARDEAYNYRNSSSISIFVDTTPPGVSLLKPDDGNVTTNQTVEFSFTAIGPHGE